MYQALSYVCYTHYILYFLKQPRGAGTMIIPVLQMKEQVQEGQSA